MALISFSISSTSCLACAIIVSASCNAFCGSTGKSESILVGTPGIAVDDLEGTEEGGGRAGWNGVVAFEGAEASGVGGWVIVALVGGVFAFAADVVVVGGVGVVAFGVVVAAALGVVREGARDWAMLANSARCRDSAMRCLKYSCRLATAAAFMSAF